MKAFHCQSCSQLVFFENNHCIQCEHKLGFIPDSLKFVALSEMDNGLWREAGDQSDQGRYYRLCRNYVEHNVCNWVIPAEEENDLCVSCCLTQVLPDLSSNENLEAWAKIEMAKRRMVYNLLRLGLPVVSKLEDEELGLAYEFKETLPGKKHKPVLTGHAEGLITLNIAEADDAERERRRLDLGEPYRSLLGHHRHEVGHYYWDLLIRDKPALENFRQVFGDERLDYAEALKAHYAKGDNNDWQGEFVSSYAQSHPWEDWAETWAHYMHIAGTLETAAACGVSIQPHRSGEPQADIANQVHDISHVSFQTIIDNWLPTAYVLNNLNRSMGLQDAYPFILSPAVINKLEFVHNIIRGAAVPEPIGLAALDEYANNGDETVPDILL